MLILELILLMCRFHYTFFFISNTVPVLENFQFNFHNGSSETYLLGNFRLKISLAYSYHTFLIPQHCTRGGGDHPCMLFSSAKDRRIRDDRTPEGWDFSGTSRPRRVEQKDVRKGRKGDWARNIGCQSPAEDVQAALVRMTEDITTKGLEKQRERIVWIYRRMSEKLDLGKCYRCWWFDNLGCGCKGPDRSKNCLNWDEVGHKYGLYTKYPKCTLCVNGNGSIKYPTGSFSYIAYKEAFETR